VYAFRCFQREYKALYPRRLSLSAFNILYINFTFVFSMNFLEKYTTYVSFKCVSVYNDTSKNYNTDKVSNTFLCIIFTGAYCKLSWNWSNFMFSRRRRRCLLGCRAV
jgi:hypothetical protein